MVESSGLTASVDLEGLPRGHLLARVSGVVDMVTEVEFARLLEQLVAVAFPVVVLDVGQLRHLSAAGGRLITECDELLAMQGGVLHLVCGPDGPRSMLRSAGMTHEDAYSAADEQFVPLDVDLHVVDVKRG